MGWRGNRQPREPIQGEEVVGDLFKGLLIFGALRLVVPKAVDIFSHRIARSSLQNEDPRLFDEIDQLKTKFDEYVTSSAQLPTDTFKRFGESIESYVKSEAQRNGLPSWTIQRVDKILSRQPHALKELGERGIKTFNVNLLRDPDVLDYDLNESDSHASSQRRAGILGDFANLALPGEHKIGEGVIEDKVKEERINQTVAYTAQQLGIEAGLTKEQKKHLDKLIKQLAEEVLKGGFFRRGRRHIRHDPKSFVFLEQVILLTATGRYIANQPMPEEGKDIAQTTRNILGTIFLREHIDDNKKKGQDTQSTSPEAPAENPQE